MTCSLSQFLLWVKQREKVPTNDDEAYVVSYSYKLSSKRKTKIKALIMQDDNGVISSESSTSSDGSDPSPLKKKVEKKMVKKVVKKNKKKL